MRAALSLAALTALIAATPAAAELSARSVPLPPGDVTEFANGFVGDSIAVGPEGELWGTDAAAGQIDRMTLSGILTRKFDVATGNEPDEPLEAHPSSIVQGTDDAMWFIDGHDSEGKPLIGRITPTGYETAYPVAAAGEIGGLAVGAEGDLWFTIAYGGTEPVVGRLEHGGATQLFSIQTGTAPDLPIVSEPSQILLGADGNLWFADEGLNIESHALIGRISPIGVIAEFPIPQIHNTIEAMTLGPDGEVWFQAAGEWLYRISAAGEVSAAVKLPHEYFSWSQGLVAGSDGALWSSFETYESDALERIAPSGEVLLFSGAPPRSGALFAGPDGALWYSTGAGVARITLPLAPASSGAPTISGTTTVGETLTATPGAWTHEPASLGYQWQLCSNDAPGCEPIPGATGASVTLNGGEVGRTLRVAVKAANVAGETTAYSATTAPILAVPVAVPPPRIVPLPEITAAMTWKVAHEGRLTVIRSMVLSGLPASGSVAVACSGKGCPFSKREIALPPHLRSHCSARRCKPTRFTGVLDLTHLLGGRRLEPGTRVAVTIVKPGTVGKAFHLTMRAGKRPTFQIVCLAVNSRTRAERC